MPARPGAFNANFAPDTLESFKAVCRDRGEKYTKILEQFAVLYINTRGEVLEQLSVGSSRVSSNPIAASSPITTRGTYAEMLERLESARVGLAPTPARGPPPARGPRRPGRST